jgi:uroporphyrinogen decarboxylase
MIAIGKTATKEDYMGKENRPNFERYMTALNCEEPDRVPLGEWHVDQLAKEGFLGRKIESLKDEVEFWGKAGFDYVSAASGILESTQAPDRMTGDEMQTKYGDKVKRSWAREHEGVITNWEQFEKFSWPSPDDSDLSKWGTFDKILPAGMKAVFLFGRIVTPVWMYMGTETFYYALQNNEELVAALFEKVKEIQYEIFLRVIEHKCVGAVLNNDDIAHNNGLMIHPKYLRKYVFPFYKKVGDVCRDRGLGYVFHSDGDCTTAMDELIECGYQGFNPVQPNAMDIVEVKRKWGKKLCLIGNINLDSTLTLGTPEDVKAEVHERIRTLAPGGGYMVASSNSITDYVPLENMKAMLEATFAYGQYPIRLEKGTVKGKISTYTAKPIQEKARIETAASIKNFASLLLDQNSSEIIRLINAEGDSGSNVSDAISKGVIAAMTLIGQKYQAGDIFIPEMMISANTMAKVLAHFKEKFVLKGAEKRGSVVIGTVRGDMHDIGKNLVVMMLEGQGFKVKDLGISVAPEKFLQVVKEEKPEILGLSALLTTTMVEMKNTIEALKKAGLRAQVKVIVGGAPVTQAYAEQIGADGYAYDAPGAAQKCKELLSL